MARLMKRRAAVHMAVNKDHVQQVCSATPVIQAEHLTFNTAQSARKLTYTHAIWRLKLGA